jgi:LmbE family N-acetylglucosaminyl deacetylase
MLMARKLPSLWGPDRPFPACNTVREAYAARHAADVSRRDAWRRKHGAADAPRDVDIADWSRRGAIVLSPHPDDEVIGCGGTLLDIVAHGGMVTIVQVTDGSESAAFIDEPEAVRTQVRLDEAKVVADWLGARELVCLRADNRALRATDELRDRVRDALERSRAGLVFAPSFTDIHPDHQAVLELLAGALRSMSGPKPDVVLYEVWSLVAPTHLHAVHARMNELETLLFSYETALKVDDYVHFMAERLLFNACTYLGRSGYCEAFEALSAERFLEITASDAKLRAGAGRSA